MRLRAGLPGLGRFGRRFTIPFTVQTGALVSPPVITGTARVGQTLSVSNGSWTSTPTGFSHQWFQLVTSDDNFVGEPVTSDGLLVGVALTGATGTTYVVQSSDVGEWIFCEVTVTLPGGAMDMGQSNIVGAISENPVTGVSFTTGTMPVGFTYQQNAARWRVTNTGVIESLVNQGRFDYTTTSPFVLKGLLLEPGTNQKINPAATKDLTTANSWTFVGTGFSLSSGIAAPDGSGGSDYFAETNTNGRHLAYIPFAGDTSVHTHSVWFKANDISWVWVGFAPDATGNTFHGRFVNLSTGALGGTVGTISGSRVTSFINNWYRIEIDKALTSQTWHAVISLAAADGTAIPSYQGGQWSASVLYWGGNVQHMNTFFLDTNGAIGQDSLRFTPPAGTTTITVMFDDNSTQSLSYSGSGVYEFQPTSLNRRWIKSIDTA